MRVCVDYIKELLLEMGIMTEGKPWTDVHMFGSLKGATRNTYLVELSTAEEVLHIPKEKVFINVEGRDPAPLFVDFGFTIKQVDGLKFGNGSLPLDYYNSREEAEAAQHKREAEQEKKAEESIEQEIPQNVQDASAAVATLPTPTPPTPPPVETAVIPPPAPPTPAESPVVGRPSVVNPASSLTDVSDSDDDESSNESMPGLVNPEDSWDSDSSEDSMTDDEEEKQSDHEEETFQWQTPQNWAKEREQDPFVCECGEATWTCPANREHCYSTTTGLEQDYSFNVVVAMAGIELFLDALPLSWWRHVVKCSLAYAKAKHVDGQSRPFQESWFTASNYMRLFAAIIMRGLVMSKDDPDFFEDSVRGNFVRTGATKVIGLTLNQYQQLLRYMRRLHACTPLSQRM